MSGNTETKTLTSLLVDNIDPMDNAVIDLFGMHVASGELKTNTINSRSGGATGTTVEGVKFVNGIMTLGGGSSGLETYIQGVFVSDMTGIWAADQSASFNITKIGRIVIIQLNTLVTAVANAAADIQSVSLLNAEFRPSVTARGTFAVLDNGVDVMGSITIDATGLITIFADVDEGAFAGAGASGIRTSSFTYTV